MTCQPHQRMYTSWCAYQRDVTKSRDNTDWDTMVIMYVHEQQMVVAMLEHALNARAISVRQSPGDAENPPVPIQAPSPYWRRIRDNTFSSPRKKKK
jgi:hypothetical protein